MTASPRRARFSASGAPSTTTLPCDDDRDALGEPVGLLEVVRREQDRQLLARSRAARARPTSPRAPRGRGRSSARRGRGPAAGGRGPSRRRGAASARRSRCGRARRPSPRARTARAARGARRSSSAPRIPCRRPWRTRFSSPVAARSTPGRLRHVADRAAHRGRLAAHVVAGDRRRAARRRVLSVTRIRTVVDLPAPFGPSRPKTWPAGTEKVIPSSARTSFP